MARLVRLRGERRWAVRWSGKVASSNGSGALTSIVRPGSVNGVHARRERQSLEIHRRVAEELRRDPARVVGKARENLNRWGRTRGEAAVSEWRRILDEMSVAELGEFLVSREERAMQMRQNTPFVGILSAAEIWDIKRSDATA